MSYSSKLSAHYLELAKVSVSKENFAGEDVRFSSEFEALESELAKASSMHESGQIDWLKIRENSEKFPAYPIQGFACRRLADLVALPA